MEGKTSVKSTGDLERGLFSGSRIDLRAEAMDKLVAASQRNGCLTADELIEGTAKIVDFLLSPLPPVNEQ